MHVATGRVKRMSPGFASTWGATPATHTKQPTFATCTIFVWLHAGYATTLKQIYRGNEPMTAQEWLDELERLREAATPGPWKHNIEPRRDGMGFIWPFSSIESEDAKAIEDEEENVTDNITRADATYIVAACNAVPRLVEMVKYLSEEASGEVSCSGEWVIRTTEEVLQDEYQATEPKE